MRRFRALIFALLLAAAALPARAETAAGIEAAWRGWMTMNGRGAGGGSWAFGLTNAFDGPLHIAYATFAVRWSALDVNIAVYMDSVPAEGGSARNELDSALGGAARKVTRWP